MLSISSETLGDHVERSILGRRGDQWEAEHLVHCSDCADILCEASLGVHTPGRSQPDSEEAYLRVIYRQREHIGKQTVLLEGLLL